MKQLDAIYPSFIISDVNLSDDNLEVIIITDGFKFSRPDGITLTLANGDVFDGAAEFEFAKVKANAVNARYRQGDKEVLKGVINLKVKDARKYLPAVMQLHIGFDTLTHTIK